ncbi:hypothetical protein C8F04DRAFT_1267025 [Mycena alexandri]|uniref:Uncharacterized protein n=1 Tax=Mycena alexandri TaxID=1745969 RepID=A0AAD6WXX1_9AGAR|nr:hypothetical protein C8F04DRAFT_1267025 [Mycena alexandri]
MSDHKTPGYRSRRAATRQTRPESRASTRRSVQPSPLKENDFPAQEDDNPLRKKRKRNAPTSEFLNPFPDPTEEREFPIPPPPKSWTVVPPEQMTYGYTPSQTPSQLEAQVPLRPELSADIVEPPRRDNFSDLNQSPYSPVIDPLLEDYFSDSFDPPSPHNQAGPSRLMSEAPSAPSETPLTYRQRPTYQKPHSLPSVNLTKEITQHQPRFSNPTLPAHDLPPAFSPPSISDPSRTSLALLPPNLIQKANRAVAPIPKAVTDKFADQEGRILFLERALKTNEQVRKKFASEIEDLDGENHQLLHRVDMLEELVERQTATMDRLFELLENDEGTVGVAKVSKGKGTRDNALNGATRKVFLVAMGLPKTAKYKDAALVSPVKAGGSYIPDPATPNGTLLRPDWKTSFNENSVWHAAMVKFTRQKVPTISPAIPRTVMDDKSEEEILERLAAVFRNISAEYRKAPKLQPPAFENAPDTDPKRTNRHKGRKVRKCEERVKVLQAEGIKIDQEWDWLLTPTYQSTDESDDSDVLDPDTDTEKADEIPVKSTRKPWLSRTPMYRSDAADAMVDEWEKRVMNYRKNHERSQPGKAGAHPRIRGDWKDTPLPLPPSGKPKIRRAAIHPDWLAANPDQDTPSRIHEEEIASEADNEGSDDDNGY